MRNGRLKKGKIFVISGPSGSGKTTLLEKLLRDKTLKRIIIKSVSVTTRPKRSAERNKRDYFFVSEGEFKQRRREKKFLEWTKYLGYYYATPKDFLREQIKKGRHLLLCLDLRGALEIKRLYPKEAVTIFVMPPSITTLRERIRGRCSKTQQEEIRHRLRLAKDELCAWHRYDYCLVNKNLTEAAQRLKDIILEKVARD